MGQKTGILNKSINVHNIAITKAFEVAYLYVVFALFVSNPINHFKRKKNYQNLNSGSFLMKGLNSVSPFPVFGEGSKGPSVSGSMGGERKEINRLRR